MPVLHFKGKSVIQNHHHTVKFHELNAVPKKGLSKEPSLDDNLVIHGDNLTALKALLPVYAGTVKCIYIDPPYNTGNEGWAYNDNVNSPMIREWLGKVVDKDDLARHEKWACMMYPRLSLLRELLREDGMIFVSVDDNEVQHLRAIMDEIFGSENFLASVIWEKADSPRMDAEFFSTRHDYVVVFAKDKLKAAIHRFDQNGDSLPEHYDKVDEDGRKYYLKPLRAMGGQGETREARPGLYYELEAPDGSKVFPKLQSGIEGAWRWSKEKYERERNRIEWRNGRKGWVPYYRIYADASEGRPPETMVFHSDVGSSRTAKAQLKEIFPADVAFDTPKPIGLLRWILDISCDKDSIVLDSFAGSGTTAHAVLAKNQEDGGNRKFILVELEDYADKITAERVRRIIKGVPDAKDETLKNGLDGSFSYYELSDPIDIDSMLEGKKLPSYEDLAQYTFFTATGESFEPSKMKKEEYYLGPSSAYEMFMLYESDAKKLRGLALNLEFANTIEKKFPEKPKLVFAPASFLEEFDLRERNIRFAQLPFEIYRLAE